MTTDVPLGVVGAAVLAGAGTGVEEALTTTWATGELSDSQFVSKAARGVSGAVLRGVREIVRTILACLRVQEHVRELCEVYGAGHAGHVPHGHAVRADAG